MSECNFVLFLCKLAKWPGGKWKRRHRGENDLAYEILGQNLPEKWGPKKEKFLPVHYYTSKGRNGIIGRIVLALKIEAEIFVLKSNLSLYDLVLKFFSVDNRTKFRPEIQA